MSWRRFTDQIVRALASSFDVVIAGDQVANGKPHRNRISLPPQLGVKATDCVAIEDSPTGVRSAVRPVATFACTVSVPPGRGYTVVNSLDQIDREALGLQSLSGTSSVEARGNSPPWCDDGRDAIVFTVRDDQPPNSRIPISGWAVGCCRKRPNCGVNGVATGLAILVHHHRCRAIDVAPNVSHRRCKHSSSRFDQPAAGSCRRSGAEWAKVRWRRCSPTREPKSPYLSHRGSRHPRSLRRYRRRLRVCLR